MSRFVINGTIMSQTDQLNTKRPFFAKWANIPFAPAKWPFFYGWTIVAVSTLAILGSVPGQTAGVGVFTDYIIDALGITRSQLSIAYMIGTIISGFILPFAGKLLDWIGVRFMSVFASVGLGLSLILLATIGTWTHWLSSLVSVGFLPMATASFAFLMIRFFGQGNMTMVGRVAMGRWFNHWRGTVTAIAGIPIAFAFNAAPKILKSLINTIGWQEACWLLAGIIGGGMTIIGLLLFRDNPEECGLLMDGRKPTDFKDKTKPDFHPIYHQFTRNEAVRTVSFWAFSLGLAAQGLIITAMVFHIDPINEEMANSRHEDLNIYNMFLISGFIAIPTRFVVSYLVDNTRLRLRWMLSLMAATTFTYTFSLSFLNTTAGWIVTTILYGITGGIWGMLCDVPMPRYFGRKHLGAISGMTSSVLVIASALGPVLFSFCKDHLGSYQNAAYVVLLLPTLVFILSFFTRNPQFKYTDSKTEL